MNSLLEQYSSISEEALWDNLKYFLQNIIPVAEEFGIKMAIHPDDPPWSIFGLPRIITNQANIQRMLHLVDSPNNGLTLCTGSLGASPDNDIPEMVRCFGKQGKIHFAHVRNFKRIAYQSFYESSHLTADGDLDMAEIMKAFYDIGFKGAVRPDHGRMIWGETGGPGYGLYDRALGAAYSG